MKRSPRFKSTIVGLVILAGTWTPVAWWAYYAEAMSSANYVIPSDAFSIGGGAGSSSSFSATDTLGEGLSGENMQSANYLSCTGFQCGANSSPYISFSVSASLASGGPDGGAVALGTISGHSVSTSNGSSINSVFVTAETNANGGAVLFVKDANGGLASASVPSDKIVSNDATLTAGSAGFGVCVFATEQRVGSQNSLDKVAPFGGACDKTSGHQVGAVSTEPRAILQTSGPLELGAAEILVKAAVSSTSAAHLDYSDTITFTLTATY